MYIKPLNFTLHLSLHLPLSLALSEIKMKKINLILRKCKSLRQLGRSSSYSSLRSKSSKEDLWSGHRDMQEEVETETIYVGSTRKRYVINSKYLNHPLLNALIDRSTQKEGDEANGLVVRCEVVLFDHLLWMLENEDPKLSSEALEELTELYVF